MKENIRQHFNQIFAEAPKTRKALDLKQEMIQNAMDKYDDMVTDGYSEEDAYRNVIESIGDVSELFPEVEEKNLFTLPEKDRKKKAMLTAVAVGIYIFAAAVFFFFGCIDGLVNGYSLGSLGLVIALLICIAPTIMLVYAANMYPDYMKKDESDMVESYKEARYNSNRETAVRKSINSIIWTLAVVLYFVISFATFDWQITWVIFPMALCVHSIVRLIFSLREDRNHPQ
ncbi:MAG: permease prefix domain 1-containing protein [Acetatifactor sp.]|nr:permease prefix domain 1-containing protein [Acetatifactor sp.]MDE7044407.1 permease prefix domain 1-containing protein [Acetatifactor sp.]